MKNILIVDDETTFLLSLKEGLISLEGDYNVLTSSNGKEAVEVMEKTKIDLLLTDIKMPVMDGFALLAHVVSKRLHIPTIVMTAFGTSEIEERLNNLGSFHFLEKPLDFKVLANKIQDMFKEGATGYIEGVSLASFLQLVEMDRKTCTLRVKSNKKIGKLYFKGGTLVHADTGTLTGDKAACEIMCWADPEIEVSGVCNIKKHSINSSLKSILLNSCRLEDEEKGSDIEKMKQRIVVNSSEEADSELDLDIIELEDIVTDNPMNTQQKEEKKMSVDDKLKEFASIEGFVGVGVFTPSGESLCSLTGDKAKNLKDIGILANSVLVNAQKASLEMGTGRGQLVHIEAEYANIIVRCLNEGTDPLRSQPGKAHIHLMLILNSDAALGLAKMKIGKIIGSLADEFRV
ncbi:MAG: hypothetical protein BWK74_00985 [Desulfobacteraceae bacterium A6]|nr:MAG: hypothetical protein BWK74_00985 [Desulfobacteraceae bacterium A6]